MTFVGKLQDGVFMQIRAKSPRKYNLLDIFAQITEPTSSSQLCAERRGMCKLSYVYLQHVLYFSFLQYLHAFHVFSDYADSLS